MFEVLTIHKSIDCLSVKICGRVFLVLVVHKLHYKLQKYHIPANYFAYLFRTLFKHSHRFCRPNEERQRSYTLEKITEKLVVVMNGSGYQLTMGRTENIISTP